MYKAKRENFINEKITSIIQINTETDFAAKNYVFLDFMDKIGNTHGMAFKMMPPRKAKTIPVNNDIASNGELEAPSMGKSNS